jgi:hypothetical protein
MGTFVYRLMGAAMLDGGAYEEIEANRHTTVQAALVVVLSSLAAGLGIADRIGDRPFVFIGIVVLALLTWFAWATITLYVGATMMPEPQTRSDIGELLRTIGFAAAPGCLQVFALVVERKFVIYAVTALWMVAAMVVAVRHALDYSSMWRAVVVCLVGWLLPLAMLVLLGTTLA